MAGKLMWIVGVSILFILIFGVVLLSNPQEVTIFGLKSEYEVGDTATFSVITGGGSPCTADLTIVPPPPKDIIIDTVSLTTTCVGAPCKSIGIILDEPGLWEVYVQYSCAVEPISGLRDDVVAFTVAESGGGVSCLDAGGSCQSPSCFSGFTQITGECISNSYQCCKKSISSCSFEYLGDAYCVNNVGSPSRVFRDFQDTNCNIDTELIDTCTSSETCTNGQCITQQSCNPTCPAPSSTTCGSVPNPFPGCSGPCQIGTKCSSGLTCDGGSCKDLSPLKTCSDTDGGKNINVKGVVTSTDGIGEDACYNDEYVYEFSCGSDKSRVEDLIRCPTGTVCVDAACKTTTDVCVGKNIDDNNKCTTDSCNSVTGQVIHQVKDCGTGSVCIPATGVCEAVGECTITSDCRDIGGATKTCVSGKCDYKPIEGGNGDGTSVGCLAYQNRNNANECQFNLENFFTSNGIKAYWNEYILEISIAGIFLGVILLLIGFFVLRKKDVLEDF